MQQIFEMDNVNIIPYTDAHHEAFRQLNLEWLENYNLLESHDLMVLDDPQGTIIGRGGYIWLAELDGKIIGSAALVKEREGEYELAKMAVTASYRGKGISKLLMDTCLAAAREIGAVRISLFSNHQLTTALKLYEKYGFRHVAVYDSPFETADVRMEMTL